jgi:hypothetical protein
MATTQLPAEPIGVSLASLPHDELIGGLDRNPASPPLLVHVGQIAIAWRIVIADSDGKRVSGGALDKTAFHSNRYFWVISSPPNFRCQLIGCCASRGRQRVKHDPALARRKADPNRAWHNSSPALVEKVYSAATRCACEWCA